ncbi:hypothetical protein FO059_14745 [Tomitella fengzijianii]|uniref:Uncharacterized protein n=1 Tax=Tomitella fengzijianii TaxID=2597660 RepID=A0A516X6Q9_9ACTN|nr:hypothetical protein FO059_14745 [Tomitella fengzijianii]
MDNPFRGRSTRWWAGAVAVVMVVGALGLWFGVPPLYHSLSARQARKSAISVATYLGLHLAESDLVVYYEHHPSFPDSSAYLVVESESGVSARDMRRRSGLASCHPAGSADFANAPPEYRPVKSPTLMSCKSVRTSHGFLSAEWDPAVDGGARTYLWATEM